MSREKLARLTDWALDIFIKVSEINPYTATTNGIMKTKFLGDVGDAKEYAEEHKKGIERDEYPIVSPISEKLVYVSRASRQMFKIAGELKAKYSCFT